ncbi:Protein of unknown function. Tetratricopeptide repeats containing protein [Tenacibaculum jejuense]|uniref:Thioredoxin domain-containing protein n=2 Tax=Tenacibaculum jejuense TaxID=584609 RepID=A0A238UF02_9FLAO|nr:Protein of unknown function. Tetratricopeptide repeats containing protein [Tenacibaculum jejuense]
MFVKNNVLIMKKQILILISFFLFNVGFTQHTKGLVTNEKGKSMLLGEVNRASFNHKDFDWFSKNYDAYLSNDKIINLLKDELQSYKIKVFFGSWCGDSKRNVPVFLKILDESNLSKEHIEIIALDRKDEAYKQSPNRAEKGLNIHRVPTFIFYKDGKEINRIVEHPKETFERDILKIIQGKKYVSKYKAVKLIDTLLNNQRESLETQEKQLIRYLPEIAEGVKELNTYGFVKLYANELEKARYAFELNAKVYPNHYVTHFSLGKFYYQEKNYKKALESLYKSLSLNSKNEKAKELIKEIEHHI